MFVQLKTGHDTDKGPAWISWGRFQQVVEDRPLAWQDTAALAWDVRRELL
jgi:hypothetical protein